MSVVASTIANGTSSMRESVCARSVLPVPVGPISRIFDFVSSTSPGLPVQENALVMVVNRDGQLLLRFVLADHVSVEKRLDLRRARQAAIGRAGLFALLVFENLLADAHALVADIRARIFRWRADELLHLLLRFMAEGTAQRLFWGEPFHLIDAPSRRNHTRDESESYCKTEITSDPNHRFHY